MEANKAAFPGSNGYTASMDARVLIIEDEEAVAWGLRKACERRGCHVVVAASAEEGLSRAAEQPPDAVFLDVRLPGMDGLTALGQLQAIAPHARIIVITAHGNLSTAVKAVEGGAFDYLAKPFDLDQALASLTRAVACAAQVAEAEPVERSGDDEIVGRSLAIQIVFKRIALVAPTLASVLITGESGTGKELVARAIHANSPRRSKPFLPVHIAALNPNLVESELFGHVRGAFTGAERAHPGFLALASGGTVFLDELGDIPLPVQAKLLRVLERQEVVPVGASQGMRVDVRLVSATNADLAEAVKEGRFRQDLFFRLNVYPIHVPPLRERPEDIPLLAEYFLRRFSPDRTPPIITPEALAELKRRTWPGNVREIRNAMEHAVILARSGAIGLEHLPAPSGGLGATTLTDKLAALVRDWVRKQLADADGEEPRDLHEKLLGVLEPALLAEVLDQLAGNRLAAGRWLGLARATVRKLIRKYQLEAGPGDDDDETT